MLHADIQTTMNVYDSRYVGQQTIRDSIDLLAWPLGPNCKAVVNLRPQQARLEDPRQ